MLEFDPQGLIPVVIQDDRTNEVLMVASMSEESLRLTRETGQTHFFSRTRNKIWHKGEQSGNYQEVRDIFVNCEENSLLIRVVQHGGAACHDGYKSCYYRRMEADDDYTTIAERVFDPVNVYKDESTKEQMVSEAVAITLEISQKLETYLSQLYGAYLYLRDNDLVTASHTSRLLHEKSHSYLTSRLADELRELAGVQSGEHVHSGRQDDTILEGSQVGYWLFLLAMTNNILFGEIAPHAAILEGYTGEYSDEVAVEQQKECLSLIAGQERAEVVRGLQAGFSLIGWACADAGVSPLAPAEYDLAQMQKKGVVE